MYKNKKIVFTTGFFAFLQFASFDSLYATEQDVKDTETLLGLDSIKDLGHKAKDKISEKASDIKDKIKDKSRELSAKAKEITLAVKENAPWGDIIKKLARSSLSGLGGCAKGALLAVPGVVLMATPTLGGSAIDLALACGAGFVKKFGPQAARLIVESIKTTADLITLDNAIKANEADIAKLMTVLQDAHDFLHENPDIEPNVISAVNLAISNTSMVIADLKAAVPVLKEAYNSAEQAFKDKKMK